MYSYIYLFFLSNSLCLCIILLFHTGRQTVSLLLCALPSVHSSVLSSSVIPLHLSKGASGFCSIHSRMNLAVQSHWSISQNHKMCYLMQPDTHSANCGGCKLTFVLQTSAALGPVFLHLCVTFLIYLLPISGASCWKRHCHELHVKISWLGVGGLCQGVLRSALLSGLGSAPATYSHPPL